jgi:hypothetical protein
LHRDVERALHPDRKDTHWGKRKLWRDPMTTVWVYVDTRKEVGDIDHVKVFATVRAAEEWFEDNDPLGVAFEYEVLE